MVMRPGKSLLPQVVVSHKGIFGGFIGKTDCKTLLAPS